MIRLLREVKIKPKYVIFENVANITSKAFSETLKLFKQDLIELGYSLYDKVLNAVDYGIPQTRRRYFLVAILGNDIDFKFIDGKGCSKTLLDYLEKNVNEKYYLTDNNYEIIDDNNILFHNKNNSNRTYVININKYKMVVFVELIKNVSLLNHQEFFLKMVMHQH